MAEQMPIQSENDLIKILLGQQISFFSLKFTSTTSAFMILFSDVCSSSYGFLKYNIFRQFR